MNRQLLLLRQGNGQIPEKPASNPTLKPTLQGKKADKELSDKGKRRAQRVGVWLAREQLQPDIVLSSPSPVARVTAEKSVKAMGLGTHRIKPIQLATVRQATDEEDADDLLSVLAAIPYQTSRVMLVGSKKEVDGLIRLFTPADKRQKTKLKPASLALLSMAGSWSKVGSKNTRISKIIHASSLPEGFPFPDPSSDELRIRPAYYYQQSSVIPYRIHNDEVQILLVSSSKMKHWVVPKGIHEPGLSSTESAAQEAFEEAGVEGEVGTEALGHYEYEKWEASCRVVVYPMLVQKVIPEDQWPEAHRGRRWCSPQEAARLVRQRELVPLIEKLQHLL